MKIKNLKSKINEIMNRKYRMEIIEDKDEGGFCVSYPELPGCLSFGETADEAIKNGEDARKEWVTAMLEEGKTIPEPITTESYSGQFRLRMPKSLHKNLAEHAKAEGISMNQYCVYLLSKINPGV